MNVKQLGKFLTTCTEEESFCEVLVDGEPISSVEFDPQDRTVKIWR